ncbi:MAG TPA: tripartite tricarboxylate transporter substrate binding protein [Terriglobales bacterium]|jgi:tripartite-type tricarboxylate transporter receptor subunit TctC|nr:tripartite tricarboxylate transporter substrate binding protein [Terriglobales bacterium]
MKTKLFAVLFTVPLLWFSQQALAEAYPSRPIRIILPAAAGGVLDVGVRRLTDTLSRSLGQPVIVDNRPGANGFIGADAAAHSKPDGYTVFLAALNVLCVNPALFAKLPYDPVRDFAPVTLGTGGNPILLVSPRLPVKTLAEFIGYAKARPGQVTYGSPSIGSSQHLTSKLLEQLTGVEMVHVPYKNQPQVMVDLIGGQIDMAIEFASVAVPHIKAGKVRALAIVGPKRKPAVPDIPTAAELGFPAFDLAGWNGFLVPSGTPPEIIARLNKEIVAALRQPEFIAWIDSLGSETIPSTPEEFASHMRAETVRWAKIVKDARIQME